MADIDLKSATPDTSLPSTGFLFGADSQSAAAPSVYSTQTVATALLGSTSLTGATITADAPVLNMAQTWNNAAVTFTGLKANITDTASNAASLLMDLQVGGTSQFKVAKNGRIYTPLVGSDTSLTAALFFSGANAITYINGGEAGRFTATAMSVPIGSSINWGNDTFLTRRAAANLRLGAADAAAPVAQTLSVQSVVAGTSNTAGANLTITGSQGTGTGAGGSIVFQVAPAGSSGTAQNALATALTISGARLTTFSGAIEQTGAPSWTNFGSGSYGSYNGAANLEVNQSIGFAPSTIIAGSVDVILRRDAANTLALRNGVNNQELRVYGSYTSASVYDRLTLKSSSTVATIAAETDAGDMDLALTPAGSGNVQFGTHAAVGAETVTGYITIKDAGGTLRKLAVIS